MLACCGPNADTTTANKPAPHSPSLPSRLSGRSSARLDLERYKATIKGLTQFGDRLNGTDRNSAAVDWIETELKGYGCATDRFAYQYPPPEPPERPAPPEPPRTLPSVNDPPSAVGGGRPRGVRLPTTPTTNLNAQTDPRLRALNAQPSIDGPRAIVYCTKIGTTHPGEMYIVSAHMDGRGFGEAANDDGSGTALVMELARIFSSPDIETERTIRFVLWNNEETGSTARARISRHAKRCRAKRTRRGQDNIRNRNGSG